MSVLLEKQADFCQSCGMPMEGQTFGTNADGSTNNAYCAYCFADGAFTKECTMEEMIDFCAPMMPENTGGQMTEAQAREMMAEFYPTLKRWK
ncbi:MAG: zinc ribbon domain-containing protein [Cellulomonadaceae bacterium]|jgi:hypothetical protein|nr:zinc ribbon domain-containing protein [Cellulomonadaceae bacterium]